MLQLLYVIDELVDPKGRAFSDRGKLSGLKMGVSEAREILILKREIAEVFNDLRYLRKKDLSRAAEDDNVRIVADVAGRSAEVYYRSCLWTLYAVRVYVGHNVVPYLFFAGLCDVKIDIVDMRLHFGKLLVGYIKAEFLFALGKHAPQLSPGSEFILLGKNVLHLVA